ncbi:N-acetylmannosamine-6-phosphate 2-epimerase [Paenibacillus sp. GCM10027629]|uniref:N-acetylmannosamine-6-phosphate 2-epimerase n=1 Tax=Paenibacillus sp. GCM10027629 TaxID=3273414 RepID=UPI0036377639
MNRQDLIQRFAGKLIVSCQALSGEALHGSDVMAKMAVAAARGGAAGIRANSPVDIAAIREQVDLPIIGLWKCDYPDSEVYITPKYNDVEAVVKAGADIVAMDATLRERPDGENLEDIVRKVKANYTCLLMADISTLEEGLEAYRLGFDIISTTLSGYTDYSPAIAGPDMELVQELSKQVPIPVFAEGRIYTPEQAAALLQIGAYAVVVGGAITRPQSITERFVDTIHESRRAAIGIKENE